MYPARFIIFCAGRFVLSKCVVYVCVSPGPLLSQLEGKWSPPLLAISDSQGVCVVLSKFSLQPIRQVWSRTKWGVTLLGYVCVCVSPEFFSPD